MNINEYNKYFSYCEIKKTLDNYYGAGIEGHRKTNVGNKCNESYIRYQGPQGPPGMRGPVGPKGPRGEKGATGPRGPMGPEGPIGETGSRGPRGIIGPMGEQGERGERGPRGEMGPTGAQGPTGANGMEGEKGDTGATGEKGSIGPTGARGETGAVGATGAIGQKGDVGPTGPMGPAGEAELKSIVKADVSRGAISNNSNISFNVSYSKGSDINLLGNTLFSLESNHVYLVAYNFRASVPIGSYILVTPRLNGNNEIKYSAKSTNNSSSLSISVSATFIVDGSKETYYIDFILNILGSVSDAAGTLSIIEIA